MMKKINNKKALSEVVGYVLLIVIAISLSLVVYVWLKNQIPKEQEKCPENLALSVSSYNCLGQTIKVAIKNNGLFDINGFLARYPREEGGLASKDLQAIAPIKSSGRIFKIINSSAELEFEFKYDSEIVEIELTPIKLIEGEMTICSDSAVRQKVEC